jgi:hypothetical protein
MALYTLKNKKKFNLLPPHFNFNIGGGQSAAILWDFTLSGKKVLRKIYGVKEG